MRKAAILPHLHDASPGPSLSIAQIKESEWFLEGGYTEADEESQMLSDVQGQDFEDAEEMEVGHEVNGRMINPQSMNAFELITMCGGLDLTPMLDKTSTGGPAASNLHSQKPRACCVCADRLRVSLGRHAQAHALPFADASDGPLPPPQRRT